ncbi:MAG TPA: TetR/AcrR family transcriptional regulator [Fibrobacter sp.]|nr:TetR/AcrR family transcriptional regulator [Fibrobacter sp.]
MNENNDMTARQLEILASAMQLIAESGFQNLTTRQLAKSIGITEAALYRHFENKQSLLEAMIRLLEEQIHSLAQVYLNGESGGIFQFFNAFLERLEKNPALAAVIFSEELFQNDLLLASKIKGLMDQLEKLIVSHVHKITKTDKIPQKHMAWMFIGSIRFLVTRWRLAEHSFSLQKEGVSLLRSLCQLFHLHLHEGKPCR